MEKIIYIPSFENPNMKSEIVYQFWLIPDDDGFHFELEPRVANMTPLSENRLLLSPTYPEDMLIMSECVRYGHGRKFPMISLKDISASNLEEKSKVLIETWQSYKNQS